MRKLDIVGLSDDGVGLKVSLPRLILVHRKATNLMKLFPPLGGKVFFRGPKIFFHE